MHSLEKNIIIIYPYLKRYLNFSNFLNFLILINKFKFINSFRNKFVDS